MVEVCGELSGRGGGGRGLMGRGGYLGFVYCSEIASDLNRLVDVCRDGGNSVGGTIVYGGGMSVWVHKA